MKLKSRPDDFQVEELTSITPQITGEFSFYRLSKKSIGTPEAINRICKKMRIDPRRVRYGGLKDRHAETVQYLTIEEGPERNFQDELIRMTYMGRVSEPYGPRSFHANRFCITLRDIKRGALEHTLKTVGEIQRGLIGNYFDDQRFGSVGADQQFVARALIDGNDELALKLAISTFYEHDRSKEKQAKAALRQHWGAWEKLKHKMPQGYLAHIVRHLEDNPGDFQRAFSNIPFFLRNMYLSAYQSHLWNRMLAEWISGTLPASQIIAVQQKYHQLPMPVRLGEEQLASLSAIKIPLPSSRAGVPVDHPAHDAITRVLRMEQLHMSEIKLKQFREPFFSKGDRAAFYSPGTLQHEVGWDKLNKGSHKLKLSFILPKGSYATLLVKRIAACEKDNE